MSSNNFSCNDRVQVVKLHNNEDGQYDFLLNAVGTILMITDSNRFLVAFDVNEEWADQEYYFYYDELKIF